MTSVENRKLAKRRGRESVALRTSTLGCSLAALEDGRYRHGLRCKSSSLEVFISSDAFVSTLWNMEQRRQEEMKHNSQFLESLEMWTSVERHMPKRGLGKKAKSCICFCFGKSDSTWHRRLVVSRKGTRPARKKDVVNVPETVVYFNVVLTTANSTSVVVAMRKGFDG